MRPHTQFKNVSISDLSTITTLLDMADKCSPNGMVETEHDWKVLKFLWNFCKIQAPLAFEYYQKEMARERENFRTSGNQIIKDKKDKGKVIQQTLSVPEFFYHRFVKFFPNQDLANKKFIKMFIEVIPEATLSDRHKFI